jgi:apyrase
MFYIYVLLMFISFSYLRFGKEASRAEILKVANGAPNPCILAGYHGKHTQLHCFTLLIKLIVGLCTFVLKLMISHFLFFKGTYTYSGEEYKAFSPASGPNFDECKVIILKALKVNYSCPCEKCTFGGIWNGGGGSGQKTLYATSSFYYVLTRVCIYYLF